MILSVRPSVVRTEDKNGLLTFSLTWLLKFCEPQTAGSFHSEASFAKERIFVGAIFFTFSIDSVVIIQEYSTLLHDGFSQ